MPFLAYLSDIGDTRPPVSVPSGIPFLARILLLHEPGVDREVLASFLDRMGHEVLTLPAEGGTDLAAADGILLVQERACRGRRLEPPLAACPTLTLGSQHVAPEGTPRERLGDPAPLDAIEAAIDRLVTGRPPPPPGRPPQSPAAARSLLLRGVAHALNNPLSAALGWMQLLRQGGEERHAIRAERELRRIQEIAHALSLLGRGSAPGGTVFDLRDLLDGAIRTLASEGFEPEDVSPSAVRAPVSGSPEEWSLMLRLLVGSFAEDGSRLENLRLALGRDDGEVVIEIRVRGVGLPRSIDPSRLDDLLFKKIRHTRALGLALAHLLVVESRGGSLEVIADRPTGCLIRLCVPEAGSPRS